MLQLDSTNDVLCAAQPNSKWHIRIKFIKIHISIHLSMKLEQMLHIPDIPSVMLLIICSHPTHISASNFSSKYGFAL